MTTLAEYDHHTGLLTLNLPGHLPWTGPLSDAPVLRSFTYRAGADLLITLHFVWLERVIDVGPLSIQEAVAVLQAIGGWKALSKVGLAPRAWWRLSSPEEGDR